MDTFNQVVLRKTNPLARALEWQVFVCFHCIKRTARIRQIGPIGVMNKHQLIEWQKNHLLHTVKQQHNQIHGGWTLLDKSWTGFAPCYVLLTISYWIDTEITPLCTMFSRYIFDITDTSQYIALVLMSGVIWQHCLWGRKCVRGAESGTLNPRLPSRNKKIKKKFAD